MSTVYDVTGVTIDDGAVASFSTSIDNVLIVDATTVPSVTISDSEPVDTLMIEVPGIQGPPGLQNVYIQSNDPAVEFGWGPEQTNYIWIQV